MPFISKKNASTLEVKMENVSIKQAEKVSKKDSKKLNIGHEYEKRLLNDKLKLNLVVVGHVDAGIEFSYI